MLGKTAWMCCLLLLLSASATAQEERPAERHAAQPARQFTERQTRAGIRAGAVDTAFAAQLERAMSESAPAWRPFSRAETSDSHLQIGWRNGAQRLFVGVTFLISAEEAMQQMRSLPFYISGGGQRASGNLGRGAIEYPYGGGRIYFRRANVVISVSGHDVELETTRRVAQLIADAFPEN